MSLLPTLPSTQHLSSSLSFAGHGGLPQKFEDLRLSLEGLIDLAKRLAAFEGTLGRDVRHPAVEDVFDLQRLFDRLEGARQLL